VKSLANFALFQTFWFAAVGGAARGQLWVGPVAVAVFVSAHLAMVPRGERRPEAGYLVGVTLVGGLVDTALHAFAVTGFPTSPPGASFTWPQGLGPIPPPWILSCWLAFACLPRFSLGWLAGRPTLAALLGAVGGPLSYLAGVRLGATEVPGSTLTTVLVLAVEYAVLTPLMLALVPRSRAGSSSTTAALAGG